MNNITLLNGDCLQKLKELEDNSVDSVVTDPPYEIGFMGKGWDDSGIANNPELWKEVLRVLKPGGHLLSFSHSRTYHRQAVAVEDAGFEIRDQIMWIYGSGFPKSHNIGKAVDKIQGNSPYEGWGTALKPAHEPIVMARKPLSEKTVARNVLEWNTGGINIDGCRVGYVDDYDKKHQEDIRKGTGTFFGGNGVSKSPQVDMQGRFPANVILDKEAGKILDEQSGERKGWSSQNHNTFNPYGGNALHSTNTERNGFHKGYDDTGGASRFFYCPKASKKDRDEGIKTEASPLRDTSGGSRDYNARCGNCGKKFIGSPNTICSCDNPITDNQVFKRKNIHPTVKPTDLMTYLVRLVTPKGGVVLDPFMGSGSTGKAAVREGMDFIGIEREDEYMEIAKSRIEHEQSKHNYRQFFE